MQCILVFGKLGGRDACTCVCFLFLLFLTKSPAILNASKAWAHQFWKKLTENRNCIGAPTYELSKYLASLVKHLVNESEYSVKNPKQFAEFVSDQEVADDELVVSFDVVSLFTSIPINMAIDIVQRKLEGSDNWRSHTQLTKGQVLDLLSFLLHNSYFVFEGTQYHQVSGCAMGSPVSTVITELVMQEVEGKALETSSVQPKWLQQLWARTA